MHLFVNVIFHIKYKSRSVADIFKTQTFEQNNIILYVSITDNNIPEHHIYQNLTCTVVVLIQQKISLRAVDCNNAYNSLCISDSGGNYEQLQTDKCTKLL